MSRALAGRTGRRALIGGGPALIVAGLVRAPAAAVRPTCRVAGKACTRASQCCAGSCPMGPDIPRRQRHRCQGSCETSTAFVCGIDITGARVEVAGPCGVWYPSACAANDDCRDILTERDPDGPLNEGWAGYTFSCLVEGWYNGRQNPTITSERTFCFAVAAAACMAVAP